MKKVIFLARHHFKGELNRYIYVAIFGKHVRIILDCLNVFLDPQYMVSQEDFQPKILNWSTLLPLLSLYINMARKRGQELW